MKKTAICLLLCFIFSVTVFASMAIDWSESDRKNFETLYGDVALEEFFEISDTADFDLDEFKAYLESRQGIIAGGLAVDSDGYLVDSAELLEAIKKEQERQEQLLEQQNKKPVIVVPEAPIEQSEEEKPVNVLLIVTVCVILLGSTVTIIIKKDNSSNKK